VAIPKEDEEEMGPNPVTFYVPESNWEQVKPFPGLRRERGAVPALP